MRESNIFANIAASKQAQKEVLHFTRRQCMKESNTVANIAPMKQLPRDHLPDTIRLNIDI